MNTENTPTPAFREFTPEEWAALAAKPEAEVLAVTTDEETEVTEEAAPTVH